MGKFVSSASRGLAEVNQGCVQFIHESVRDYFLKYGGLEFLSTKTGYTHSDSIAEYEIWSHDMIKRSCQRYLACDGEDSDFPLLEYSGEFALRHAEQAAQSAPQDDFIAMVSHKNLRFIWIEKTTSIRPAAVSELEEYCYTGRLSTPIVPTMSVLVLGNATRLIRVASALGVEVNSIAFGLPVLPLAVLTRRKPKTMIVMRGLDDTSDLSLSIVDDIIPGMKLLLDCGADSNARWKTGPTLLHYLVRHKSQIAQALEMIKVLLSYNTDLDAKDSVGRTPLLVALASTEVSEVVVRLLLDHGADVNAYDLVGYTALLIASASQQVSIHIIRMLLDNGANPFAVDWAGRTILTRMIHRRCNIAIQVLLDRQLPVEHRNAALLSACRSQNFDVIRWLLNTGIDLEFRDEFGDTPLFIAIEQGDERPVELLILAGSDMEARDARGRTALMYACYWCRKDIVSLLLANDADVTAHDGDGEPVDYWAYPGNHPANASYDASVLRMVLDACSGVILDGETSQQLEIAMDITTTTNKRRRSSSDEITSRDINRQKSKRST